MIVHVFPKSRMKLYKKRLNFVDILVPSKQSSSKQLKFQQKLLSSEKLKTKTLSRWQEKSQLRLCFASLQLYSYRCVFKMLTLIVLITVGLMTGDTGTHARRIVQTPSDGVLPLFSGDVIALNASE